MTIQWCLLFSCGDIRIKKSDTFCLHTSEWIRSKCYMQCWKEMKTCVKGEEVYSYITWMLTSLYCCIIVRFDEMLLNHHTSNNTTTKISAILPMVYENINRRICFVLRIYCISTECSLFDLQKLIDRPFSPLIYSL